FVTEVASLSSQYVAGTTVDAEIRHEVLPLNTIGSYYCVCRLWLQDVRQVCRANPNTSVVPSGFDMRAQHQALGVLAFTDMSLDAALKRKKLPTGFQQVQAVRGQCPACLRNYPEFDSAAQIFGKNPKPVRHCGRLLSTQITAYSYDSNPSVGPGPPAERLANSRALLQAPQWQRLCSTNTPQRPAQPVYLGYSHRFINNSLSVHDATSLYSSADVARLNRLLRRRPAGLQPVRQPGHFRASTGGLRGQSAATSSPASRSSAPWPRRPGSVFYRTGDSRDGTPVNLAGYGDPHLVSWDGLPFTFNGVGQYIISRPLSHSRAARRLRTSWPSASRPSLGHRHRLGRGQVQPRSAPSPTWSRLRAVRNKSSLQLFFTSPAELDRQLSEQREELQRAATVTFQLPTNFTPRGWRCGFRPGAVPTGLERPAWATSNGDKTDRFEKFHRFQLAWNGTAKMPLFYLMR
uniref:SLED domain-containing protein n=1 Tax=Macrostomum lignano TaxID=282301 RepID=A0A1I8FQR3_9PLAT